MNRLPHHEQERLQNCLVRHRNEGRNPFEGVFPSERVKRPNTCRLSEGYLVTLGSENTWALIIAKEHALIMDWFGCHYRLQKFADDKVESNRIPMKEIAKNARNAGFEVSNPEIQHIFYDKYGPICRFRTKLDRHQKHGVLNRGYEFFLVGFEYTDAVDL